MNSTEIRTTVLQVLAGIAPEAAASDLDESLDFRDQFDFDSMDFLNFAIALSKKLNRDIPERDYPRLSSLRGCLEYFSGPVAG